MDWGILNSHFLNHNHSLNNNLHEEWYLALECGMNENGQF